MVKIFQDGPYVVIQVSNRQEKTWSAESLKPNRAEKIALDLLFASFQARNAEGRE